MPNIVTLLNKLNFENNIFLAGLFGLEQKVPGKLGTRMVNL
jgi:hypothetical protein